MLQYKHILHLLLPIWNGCSVTESTHTHNDLLRSHSRIPAPLWELSFPEGELLGFCQCLDIWKTKLITLILVVLVKLLL